MEPIVLKIIMFAVLGCQLIAFLLAYLYLKKENIKSYLYALSTVLILEIIIALSLDQRLFVADHDLTFYIIEFAIFLGFELICFLITLTIRFLLKKKKE